MSADERFATNPARVRHRSECHDRIARALERVSCRDALIRQLETRRVPAAGVNAMDEVFREPGALELVTTDSETGTTSGLRQVAFRSTAHERIESIAPPPRYGEHTRSILRECLGLTEGEICDLVEAGVVDDGKV